MKFHILIPCSILPFFLLFIVYNVARFVTSGYPDKKLIASKTDFKNVLSVVGYYSQFPNPHFFFFFFFSLSIPPTLNFRSAIRPGVKRLHGGSILLMIYCVNI